MRRFIFFTLVLFVVISLLAFDESFPFGMNNTVYGIFSDTTGKYDEFRRRYKKTMDLTAYGLGIGWWRAQNKFRWGDIQPNCTTWIWDDEDSLVKWAGEREMHIIPVFGYTAPWAHHSKLPDSKKDYWHLYPPDPSYWDNYKEYVKQLVERYDGDGERDYEGLIIPIKYWEFMNEPYSRKPFLGTPKQYVEMFDSTIVALKKADPEAKIGAPCLTGKFGNPLGWYYYDTIDNIIDYIKFDSWEDAIDCIFNDSMIDTNNVDFVTFHIYDTPDNFMSVLRTLKEKVGKCKPVWITECGYKWYRWYRKYLNYTFCDTLSPDTIWIANTAFIYRVDTTDNISATPEGQTKNYSKLLDSLVKFLSECGDNKFMFFSMNVQSTGPEISYDSIIAYSNCDSATLCTLWVNRLTVRYSRRSGSLSRKFSLLRRNLTPLPAYYTIFDKIRGSNINGLKGASEPKNTH